MQLSYSLEHQLVIPQTQRVYVTNGRFFPFVVSMIVIYRT